MFFKKAKKIKELKEITDTDITNENTEEISNEN